MARVHILNVSPGDCTLIQHNSGRVTGIDICGGNLEVRQQAAAPRSPGKYDDHGGSPARQLPHV